MQVRSMELADDPFDKPDVDFVGLDLIENLDSSARIEQEVTHGRMFATSFSFFQSEFSEKYMSTVYSVSNLTLFHFLFQFSLIFFTFRVGNRFSI